MEPVESDYDNCFQSRKVAGHLAREFTNVEANDTERCQTEEIFELEDSDADEDELIALLEKRRRQLYKHSSQDYLSRDLKEKDQSKQETDDSEPDDCLLEEYEAKLIQQRQAQLFCEYDFDAELHKIDDSLSITRCEEKLVKDFSSFSMSGKWQLLCRESPELLPLISKYKAALYDLQKELVPVHEYCCLSSATHDDVYQCVEENVHLLLDFIVNISCYLIFKASNEENLHTHPLKKRILLYQMLVKELETIENPLRLNITKCWIEMMSARNVDSECLRHLLQNISKDVGSPFAKMPMVGTCRNLKLAQKLKLSQLICDHGDEAVKPVDVQSTRITSPPPIKKSRVGDSFSENFTVALYKMLTCGQLSKEQVIQLGVNKNNSELLLKNDKDDIIDENDSSCAGVNDGRRSITYEIQKNRGLTPRRKKELKNPRVKNRLKYRKAKIRRRGQIREVRHEHKPYTGEFSGIRAAVKRGTHLK